MPDVMGAAVLLDRDGTINVDTGYVSDPACIRLEEGVIDGLRLLTAVGLPLIILSNQSGVGRGYYGLSDLVDVNHAIAKQLAAHDISVAGWYICPHAPSDDCNCRKPLPGLALHAAQDFSLDLRRCWMIGDKRSDLQLGDAVGASSILLLTGEGARHSDWAKATGKPICSDMVEAARLILAGSSYPATQLQAAR
ncbi:HAD-IIIA family hydrolase [Sphingobium sp. DC-2]|uniref:D-glycero-alpha-D-manno-heptose-1,7-bisphosphate 7-phosphatase n=1 Tax=Sphingobium sp. DC-2 TaxID=1303256 RepID=UPI00068AC219|nr:HAD family hydrolase [Sphingobium sp. DC-2]